MNYGFVLDNRKCIGCHACSTACKSEHDVPVGVNRTWVKQVEKGEFPDVRRYFSVMRCNHCSDAPCVSICPTEALYIRKDGIVDFDKDRCIGCKSCMQACPYDALYIDPETNTAAKCNYCSHRIDVGLEPACVNVCPEEAIISGDLDDPNSKISKLLATQSSKTRKPEKDTQPKVFYIDADDSVLLPTATEPASQNLWGSQSAGVGHYAKSAEKMANSNPELTKELSKIQRNPKSVEVLMSPAKRVYDSPNKGILWAWEVSAYIWTKAISSGAFLLMFFIWLSDSSLISEPIFGITLAISLGFLILTGLLLIKDLDRPDRFLYVLLRPHWNSWLVKGGYAITAFGLFLSVLGLAYVMNWEVLLQVFMYLSAISALLVAVYTAFLFAQAKGRDFWQSPILAMHMLLHALMAGSMIFLLLDLFISDWDTSIPGILLIGSIIGNLLGMMLELFSPHATRDARKVAEMIYKGDYSKLFWIGVVLLGNLIPPLLMVLGEMSPASVCISALLILAGIFLNEHIWVEAPQRIPLS